jgi:hypothetical protein
MKPKNIYTVTNFTIAIGMMLALAWLTISTPFVYKAQQQTTRQQAMNVSDEEDASNPFANTTEEKTPNGFNTISEYLHEYKVITPPEVIVINHFPAHFADLYIAFHGELLSPPPEV